MAPFIIPLLLLSASSAAQAAPNCPAMLTQTGNGTQGATQAERFRSLCAYDTQQCGLAQYFDDQTFLRPSHEVIQTLHAVRDKIKASARDFGTDARAVAAVLMADQTIFFDRLGPRRVKSLGVIHYEGAEPVVDEVARKDGLRLTPLRVTERRKVTYLDDDMNEVTRVETLPVQVRELETLLENPDRVIRFAGAIVGHAQRVYAERCFDLTGQIGVLAGLYNLGKPEKFSALTLNRLRTDPKARPRVNYFGFFVDENRDAIDQILSDNPVPPPTPEQALHESRMAAKIAAYVKELKERAVTTNSDKGNTTSPASSQRPATSGTRKKGD